MEAKTTTTKKRSSSRSSSKSLAAAAHQLRQLAQRQAYVSTGHSNDRKSHCRRRCYHPQLLQLLLVVVYLVQAAFVSDAVLQRQLLLQAAVAVLLQLHGSLQLTVMVMW